MMARQTLVKRGHTVTLYEKADKLGGLLIDASMVPFRSSSCGNIWTGTSRRP